MQEINKNYILEIASKLINIDSPSGFTKNAVDYLEKEIKLLGFATEKTKKGNLIVTVQGKDQNYTLGLGAHTDTLGLMVRSIKPDGKLAITQIGSPSLPTLDGEYCRIITRDSKVYTGTILSTSPSKHVHPDSSTAQRTEDLMEVRIDEVVNSKEDTQKLGIQNGDIIAIDPKFTITDSGFIKSRFLDDKISTSALMGVLKYLKDNDIQPEHNIKIIFSTYEEVGHGSSWIPEDIDEFLAVDMGCIGLDLACTEQDVSICAKDSSGPYDYEMTTTLINLAKENNLRYAVDIYPAYSSDVSAALKGGNNIKGALIGPGVHASHGMERTHYDGVENTVKLILAYIRKRS